MICIMFDRTPADGWFFSIALSIYKSAIVSLSLTFKFLVLFRRVSILKLENFVLENSLSVSTYLAIEGPLKAVKMKDA